MFEDELEKDNTPNVEYFEEPDNVPLDALESVLDKEHAKKYEEIAEFLEEDNSIEYELTVQDTKNDTKLVGTKYGMAEIILRENYFAIDGFSGELYVYISQGKLGGTYIEATRSVELAIKQLAVAFGCEETWTIKNKRREVYDWIATGVKKKLENPDLRHMNVANGLIYLTPKGEFMHFSKDWTPEYLTIIKLPTRYDPNAKCPAWEKFISEVFPEDSQHVAWEIAALLMVPLKNKAASAIILKGSKNTGKTTFQNGILAFIGKKNTSSLSLDKFGERFQDAQLKGKLANVVGEMTNAKLSVKAVNIIKQLIGNDMLSGEIKNGASFMFESYARCLFSCNEMPTCDSDDAFFDRFNIIPFNRQQFDKNPIKEVELNESLSSPEELSGLLNKALTALPKVMKDGIIATPSMRREMKQVKEENDSLTSWFEEHVEIAEGSTLLFGEMHKHYTSREPRDFKRGSAIAFGRDLKKLLPEGVKKTQLVMPDGARLYGFRKLRFRESPIEVDVPIEFELENLV